jgi:hypothetical protein
MELQHAPSWLNVPPKRGVTPPVEAKIQVLPFEQLTWEDFERLCYRLAHDEAYVEHCQLYGNRGDEQEGIDIFTRVLGSEKYKVHQCKREKDFGPAKIKSAVEEFAKGEWVSKSDAFILCTQETLRGKARADELERQAVALKPHGVCLVPWDAEELSLKLKSLPEIVDDFFGREWVKVFCGDDVAKALEKRLDAKELGELRLQLGTLYQNVFNIHDAGIPLPSTIPLVKRYVVPDVEDIQAILSSSVPSSAPARGEDSSEGRTGDKQKPSQSQDMAGRRYIQKIPIENWAGRSNRNLLFGSPGSGKSTFLRYLALDLLGEAPTLYALSEKWGACIPLWIPFALWTKVIQEGRIGDASIRAMLEGWLKSWDAEALIPLVTHALDDKRLLLLVDGLDEYSNEDAAKIALDHLAVFLRENDSSIIATSRRHGFEKLGMNTEGWQQAQIADLSLKNQKALVDIWFRASVQKTSPDLAPEDAAKAVEHQSSAFFAELGRSNELRELAKNPLLLCLLILLQLSNVNLPLSRFEAYAALTDHLILKHPQYRRRAAGATQQQELKAGDVKKILAHFALTLHTKHQEGLLADDKALEAISAFLRDASQGFGMEHYKARQVAESILEQAEKNLGIVVRRSRNEVGFYHRTIQEYLAAFDISRMPAADQLAIVDERCNDPVWRDVLLCLFQLTNRTDDIKLFLEAITKKAVVFSDKKLIDDLLSEVAFGDYNCPPDVARALALKSYKEVEVGTWMPHREKILGHVLDGLRSPILSPEVEDKVKAWFPNRLGYQQASLFGAMDGWTPGPDLRESLLKGFRADDYRTKVAAGSTLAKLYKDDAEVEEMLVRLASKSDDILLMAAATETLRAGWPSRKELPTVTERFVSSSVPILQLVGIANKTTFGTQTDKDLERLFSLARWESGLYAHGDAIADIILRGWPRSDRVKDVCLRSLVRWGDRETCIERGIAQHILLEGYAGDEQVVAFCVNELEHDDYPLNASPGMTEGFRSLSVHFKGNPKIAEALEHWAQKNGHHLDMELSFAALVGKTDAFKARLIEGLDHPFPHWPAHALLEGWGMDDKDVAQALQAAIAQAAAKSSQFAHLMPEIVPDKSECRAKLLDMLKDPTCERYDFVMRGFEALGSMEGGEEIIEAALLALKRSHRSYIDGFAAGLIQLYPSDKRIRTLAIETLNSRDGVYAAVAKQYGSDPEIRTMVLHIANPLPAPLRQTIANYLSESEMNEAFALSTLSLYDHDVDEQVKVQAAIGFHSKLKMSGIAQDQAVERLEKDIVCYGPDYRERRLAAFCGLVILGRLDLMIRSQERLGDSERKVAVESVQGLHPNIPYMRFVLKNWDDLRAFFKEEFWDRLFRYHSGVGFVWEQFARFADEYDTPKSEALEYFERADPKIAVAEALRFLGRTLPGSRLLLEYCLNTIALNKVKAAQVIGSRLTILDEGAAASLIADHFGGDPEVLKVIVAEENKWKLDEVVLSLSEGWPDSAELRQVLTEMAKSRTPCWESTVVRFHCVMSGPIIMYKQILRLLRYLSRESGSARTELIVRPIIRRIQKDDRLFKILMRHLNCCPRPNEKVSIPQLIERARGLSPELKAWGEKELENQMNREGGESGLDLFTGEFTSVPFALYQMLSGS